MSIKLLFILLCWFAIWFEFSFWARGALNYEGGLAAACSAALCSLNMALFATGLCFRVQVLGKYRDAGERGQ